MDKKLLTPKQAAAHAGVSASLVYRWTTVERRLPHFRLGGSGRRGKILIDEAELEAFLAGQRVAAPGEEKPTAPGRSARPVLTHLSLS